jgi:acyl carrier protein
MNREQVEERIRRILVEDFRIAADRIDSAATLRGTLGLDSMDAIDFLLLIHKEFGFEAKVEDYQNLVKLDDLVDFVHRRALDGQG